MAESGWPFFSDGRICWGPSVFRCSLPMVMAAVSLKAKHRADTIIGVIWAVGMAIGIILLDLTPGYNVDLMSYLFGSILTVPTSDLLIMLALSILITFLVAIYYKDLLALSYDEEFARLRGVPVKMLYFTLIGMLALTIVMVIQVVGLISGDCIVDYTALYCGKACQIPAADDGWFQFAGSAVHHDRPVVFLCLQSHIRGCDHHRFRGRFSDFAFA